MAKWTADDERLIRAQVERMAGCPIFAQGGRMPALLRYLVDAELAGTARDLKQYRIAIDVLGRDARFDPAIDSIVRVEIGRLRSKLVEFYATDGAADAVVLGLPKGRYQPTIELRSRAPAAAALDVPKQEIRYCSGADGTSLAFAIAGRGYPLVKSATWLSHLEFDHQSPVWRHWWRELANRYQLIRYDTRGGGLSDWHPPTLDFEACVEDLSCVVEAAGVERFALFGMSQGVSVAVAYAARHPERVSHLILYGGFVRGQGTREDPQEYERFSLLEHLIRVGWGDPQHAFRQVFGAMFIPDGTSEQFKWFDELQRASMSAANASEFFKAAHRVDLRPLLREIRVPTLVIHANRDAAVPFSEAKVIAGGIKGAQLKLLDSNNHVLFEDEPAWPRFLEEIDAFIAAH
jgi:pimeloyl-ACP methyl ester carboxylesterase